MNLKSTNKPETNLVELEIEVSKEEFQAAVSKAFKKNASKMNVQGFRKGKAPRNVIERMYGESVFYEDAVNECYPVAYDEAVKESEIKPVDSANIDIVEINKDGFTFKAKVYVKPIVEVKNYKGLEALKPEIDVKDQDVNAEIEKLRERNARIITVAHPIEMDDVAIIDFEGFDGDVPFEGGKGDNYSLKIGSGQFIPGFEEALIGKSTGECIDVNVSFPEDYHQKELAGKPVLFKVKINEVKSKELVALDDEFAKDVSEFDTLEDLKADTKTKLIEARTNEAENAFEQGVIDALIENTEVEVPTVMIEKRIDEIAQDFDYRLKMQGMDLETYLKYTGSDTNVFRKSFEAEATRQVKSRLALEKVAELEKIVISEEELDEEYKNLTEKYKTEIEKVKAYVPVEDILVDISIFKASQMVKNSAKVK